MCAADCGPYLWWLYHNFSLNCCHLSSILPALHFASICIILLCYSFYFFTFFFLFASDNQTETQSHIHNLKALQKVTLGYVFKTVCIYIYIYNCKKNQSVSFMTPEVPLNIFNELKEIREHLLQQEDYYLYLWGFCILCAETCLFSDSSYCKIFWI